MKGALLVVWDLGGGPALGGGAAGGAGVCTRVLADGHDGAKKKGPSTGRGENGVWTEGVASWGAAVGVLADRVFAHGSRCAKPRAARDRHYYHGRGVQVPDAVERASPGGTVSQIGPNCPALSGGIFYVLFFWGVPPCGGACARPPFGPGHGNGTQRLATSRVLSGYYFFVFSHVSLRKATMHTGVFPHGHHGERSLDRMVFAHGHWINRMETQLPRRFNHPVSAAICGKRRNLHHFLQSTYLFSTPFSAFFHPDIETIAPQWRPIYRDRSGQPGQLRQSFNYQHAAILIL
ncbi:MAG: hypothetical protein JWR26_945 [Pedosphaera sp.]|nr:hypothetical protein [Pedosphaera sp.]